MKVKFPFFSFLPTTDVEIVSIDWRNARTHIKNLLSWNIRLNTFLLRRKELSNEIEANQVNRIEA